MDDAGSLIGELDAVAGPIEDQGDAAQPQLDASRLHRLTHTRGRCWIAGGDDGLQALLDGERRREITVVGGIAAAPDPCQTLGLLGAVSGGAVVNSGGGGHS